MKPHAPSRSRMIAVVLFFFAAAFALPALSDGDSRLFLLAAAVPGVLLFFGWIPTRIFSLDSPLVWLSLILCAFSVLAPAASDPGAAVTLALSVLPGLLMLLFGTVLLRSFRPSVFSALSTAFCGLLLLSFPLFSASLSISLTMGGLSLLLLAMVASLSIRARFLALFTVLSGLFLLFLEKDTLFACIWSLSCVLVFWACSGSSLWTILAVFSSAALTASIWAVNGLPAFQPVPSTTRLHNLGLIGSLQPPEQPVPVSGTSVFLALGNQYGLILLLCVFFLFLLLLLRCSSLAQCARQSFHASIALGAMLLLGFRILFFFLSLTEILPWSAVDLPLLTASMPDLCGTLFLIGFLSGVSARNRKDLEEDSHLAMLAH